MTRTTWSLLAAAALAGCGPARSPGGPAVAEVAIRGQVVRAELALDPDSQSRGLSLRKQLAADAGMLFFLPEDQPPARFWMKDTFVPLAIAFLDADGVILDIRHMEPFDEVTLYTAGPHARYALEVNDGWFDQHAIAVGDRAELPAGPAP